MTWASHPFLWPTFFPQYGPNFFVKIWNSGHPIPRCVKFKCCRCEYSWVSSPFYRLTEFIWDPREEWHWPVQTRPCPVLRMLSYFCSRAPFVFPSLKTSGSSPCSPPWRVCRLTWDEVLKQSSLSINQITKTDFNLLKFRYSLKSNSYLELCLEFPSWLLTQSSDPFLDDQPVTIGHRGLRIKKITISHSNQAISIYLELTKSLGRPYNFLLATHLQCSRERFLGFTMIIWTEPLYGSN